MEVRSPSVMYCFNFLVDGLPRAQNLPGVAFVQGEVSSSIALGMMPMQVVILIQS